MKLPVIGFVASSFDNNLWCSYGEDARCLALLMPPLVALPKAGFNRVKFLDTGFWQAVSSI
jgi:hypothetical protein